jgi:4-nitrophenyl phosphatase
MIDFDKDGIKAVFLDMDGVLWRGSEPLGDLPNIFSRFSDLNLPVVLATNNATNTVRQYIQKLDGLGVRLSDWQIATSGEAVVYHLVKKYPAGARVYIVGMPGLKEMVEKAGFVLADSDVRAVIVGVDRDITYEKIKVANRLIRGGAEFIGTNPDVTFPTPEGLDPGAGSIIAAVTAATEQEPLFVGKPGNILMDLSLSRLENIAKDQILMVGDRLETDIAAGQAFGARTALVLSGVTTIEMARKWSPSPDYIFSNLSELVGVC